MDYKNEIHPLMESLMQAPLYLSYFCRDTVGVIWSSSSSKDNREQLQAKHQKAQRHPVTRGASLQCSKIFSASFLLLLSHANKWQL